MRAVDGVSVTRAETRALGRQDVPTVAVSAIHVETRSKISTKRFAMRDGNDRDEQQYTRYQ